MTDGWEGGRAQGVAWRRLLGTALVGAVAAVAWLQLGGGRDLFVTSGDEEVAGPEEDVEVVVAAPELAGDRWLCPRPFPVKAYETGMFYPAEHPGPPSLTQRPTACYRDPERAVAAGYELAAPPAGAELAGGLYLVPVVTPALAACRDLTDHVDFEVVCPTRLPWPANGSSCASSTCLYADGVVIEQRGFPIPDGWCLGCDAHVVIVAMPRRPQRVETVSCGAAHPIVADEGEFVDCPPGDRWLPRISGDPHEGHTLTGWRSDDALYALSVDGHGPRQRAFLEALLVSLERP